MRGLYCIVVFLLFVIGGTAGAQTLTNNGSFIGELKLLISGDGRTAELLEDYGYKDPSAIEWHAPKGTVVDGASIPQPLWSFIGGPFSGKYRNASVIHDHYCDTKSQPWQKVHRVFYDAMLTSGVDKKKAVTMYLAVYWFGPRWNVSVVLMDPRDGSENKFLVRNFQSEFSDEKFEQLQQDVEEMFAVRGDITEEELNTKLRQEEFLVLEDAILFNDDPEFQSIRATLDITPLPTPVLNNPAIDE